jgi:hypothetical protein
MHRKYQQQDTLNAFYRQKQGKREAIDCDGERQCTFYTKKNGRCGVAAFDSTCFSAEEDETNGHCVRNLSLSPLLFLLTEIILGREIYLVWDCPVLGQSERGPDGDLLSPTLDV